jgi:hypothetical protein
MDGGGTVHFDLLLNNSLDIVDTLSMTSVAGGALWGTFVWGTTALGSSSPASNYRYRIGRTGELARLRIRHLENDEPLMVQAVGLTAELKSDRIG